MNTIRSADVVKTLHPARVVRTLRSMSGAEMSCLQSSPKTLDIIKTKTKIYIILKYHSLIRKDSIKPFPGLEDFSIDVEAFTKIYKRRIENILNLYGKDHYS